MEAPSRIELLHKGFADLSLTTWARRRDEQLDEQLKAAKNGAGDGVRTRDLNFGKVAFYH